MTWEVLCKCSGKYIDIYFNLKITCLYWCFGCFQEYYYYFLHWVGDCRSG